MDNTQLVTDDTLPDNAWKDSFDKLLDQRPILRELNLIKRDVRASFNMNSSYENSSSELATPRRQEDQVQSTSALPKMHHLSVPKANLPRKFNKLLKGSHISTPVKSNVASKPFKCTLSPIGPWELHYFKKDNQIDKRKTVEAVPFNATRINENAILDIEYVDEPSTRGSPKLRYSLGLSPLAIARDRRKHKQNQKQVCFAASDVQENNEKEKVLDHEVAIPPSVAHDLSLQPGKWRKSLYLLRRTQNPIIENEENNKIHKKFNKGRSTGALKTSKLTLNTISVAGQRKSILIGSKSRIQTRSESRSTYSQGCDNFKRKILQRCGQRRVLAFAAEYNEDYIKNCRKIGEGAFAEVFLYTNPNDANNDSGNNKTVLKIIPIEGKELVNGEVQKTFEQILPEVIISMELCGLNDKHRKTNITSGYVNLQRVRCIKGEYPAHLKKLWEDYDLKKESENDHPDCFSISQHYIILELAFGGQDLEGFTFKNAEQSYSALQQIILTLAVGENEYQFEHRDLHWGNVLVINTNQQYISYKLGDKELTIPTKGVKITVIDYTLSRITLNDYCYYQDLSNDEELFSASGDYQFEIYRMMREVLNDKWETFEPKTNIFWISYILSKMLDGVSYKNVRSKLHVQYMETLKQLQTSILTYKSCIDCATDIFTKVK